MFRRLCLIAGQRIFVVQREDYVYLVPFVEDDQTVFLPEGGVTKERLEMCPFRPSRVAMDITAHSRLVQACPCRVAVRTYRRHVERSIQALEGDLMHRKVCVLAVGIVMLAGSAGGAAGQGNLEELMKGLENSNPGARAMAAMSLARMGSEAAPAVPALAKALSDQNLNVRYSAASALKAVGPAAQAAVGPLIKALDTFPGGSPVLDGPVRYYPDVRSVAAEALGAIGSRAKDAVPALKKALNDPDAGARSAAADALKRITAK